MSGSDQGTKANILYLMSGSIACYKSCAAVSALVQEGYSVRTALTRGARRFVGPATLEGLTGHPVFGDAFEPGRMMDHIHLAEWADAAVLAPASASALNRLAAGTADDDPVTTVFLAYDLAEKPFFVAPAMNRRMWAHPAVRESIAKLQSWGVRLIPPEDGPQACGDVGEGRLAEPESIREALTAALTRPGGPA